MVQIICQDLAIGYDGKAIVQKLDLSINQGEYLCIVGENGAGKSTLVKTLIGLLQPVRGKIALGDGMSQKEIGYLPQQTETQKDFPASVREIVLSGCQNRCGLRPFYNRKEKMRAEEMMRRLQITDLEKRCYRELSGGQQQRTLLARALCATKKLLLLDEPVSGLDPKATEEMYQLIRSINREEKITIVMISHDIQAAITYASHILYLGDTLFYGTKEEFLQNKAGEKFLGVKGGME